MASPFAIRVRGDGQGRLVLPQDGLPVLDLDRAVTNAEVLAAIEGERHGR